MPLTDKAGATTPAANNPLATCSSNAASRAKTPTVSSVGANGITPATEISPCEGRQPQIPQLLAGTRTEPPVSVPIAKSTMPQATADAEPLEEPPGTRSGTTGLSGVP